MSFTAIAHSTDDLDALAPAIIDYLADRHIVALDAPMGAGKTTLVKALMKHLGSTSIVNSPTFAIINDYEMPDGNSAFHFDLYRLKNIEEALNMGFDDYFYSGAYCFIEWPDVARPLLPDDIANLTISVDDDGSRRISIG